ncbi:hypothetical protein [Phenylobacterium sp.]|uniref:hypothetical protein n=1 Tax=Phenylobacterium sp. TaxID=1871053 RepID=UPI002C4CAA81|nr:hypothetical protein [Phenylobacterium sp.]HVI33224.1 hypothetical protein [Phenylobacterium sp.]
MPRTSLEDLQPELATAIRANEAVVLSYLSTLSFIVMQGARDPSFRDTHVFSYLAQDLLQSAMALIILPREGILNAAKRELRFVLEASIKLAFVEQEGTTATVQEKLERFDKELASAKISVKNALKLQLLPEADRDAFRVEVGRLFSLTSGYVHLTPSQILESISAAEAGITAGKERPSDVESLTSVVERVLAVSLVLLFHAFPYWVAGDWMVEENGLSNRWHFSASRFVAAMDSEFDYKHERQKSLPQIQRDRQARIRF